MYNSLSQPTGSGLVPSSVQRVSPLLNTLIEQQKKEEAAIFMCGGMLGDCYILQEIIDSFMVDVESMFRKEKWYMLTLKQNFHKCIDELRKCMASARYKGASGADLMRCVADAYDDKIQPQIRMMYLGAGSELGKYHDLEQPNIVAIWITIDTLFLYLKKLYDDRLEYMKNVFPTNYDRYYSHASGRDARRYFEMALNEFVRRYIHFRIDANNIDSINRGMMGIINTVSLLNKDDSIKQSAMEETGQDAGDAKWDESLRKLGIRSA